MFHGMPDDPEFQKLKNEFAKVAEKAGWKDNARQWYEKKRAEAQEAGEEIDPFEQFWSNDVDGRIRQLFQPTDKDHDIFMSEMTPEMKTIGEKIVKYMQKKH